MWPSGWDVGLKIKRSSVTTVGNAYKWQANFSFHSTSAYSAVMGAWWTRIVMDWLKLPAYLYDVCAVYSVRKDEIAQVVSFIIGKCTDWLNME